MNDKALVAIGIVFIILNLGCIVLNTVVFPNKWPVAIFNIGAAAILSYTTGRLAFSIWDDER